MKSGWKFLELVVYTKARIICVKLKSIVESEDFNCTGFFVKH
jgi:hypothetical protein